MSKEVILKVENVSKLYRLGTVGTGTFGGDVQRFWKTKILGQEDPFLKVGQTNDRTSKEKADFVWALKDINFEVKRGEVIGVIGKNGAGKSTLLKLLSRITTPTTGYIKSAGRMASLLEVGTGFHPELTGRENVYLNGAILGMTKKEIDRKFDEIVDFSGCELYIDTPTKRYSSGMTVRLGFAIAAFLEPEILIIDEVLAVGDAEFQKRAVGRLKTINDEGRTVIFVSHDMGLIKKFCPECILMENGVIKAKGNTDKIIEEYFASSRNHNEFKDVFFKNDLYGVSILKFSIINNSHEISTLVDFDKTYFEVIINTGNPDKLFFGISIINSNGVILYSMPILTIEQPNAQVVLKYPVPTNNLIKGNYSIEGAIWNSNEKIIQSDNLFSFSIESRHTFEQTGSSIKGSLFLNDDWIL
jgi:lipopolysaccharide transport system ATP-binding protein